MTTLTLTMATLTLASSAVGRCALGTASWYTDCGHTHYGYTYWDCTYWDCAYWDCAYWDSAYWGLLGGRQVHSHRFLGSYSILTAYCGDTHQVHLDRFLVSEAMGAGRSRALALEPRFASRGVAPYAAVVAHLLHDGVRAPTLGPQAGGGGSTVSPYPCLCPTTTCTPTPTSTPTPTTTCTPTTSLTPTTSPTTRPTTGPTSNPNPDLDPGCRRAAASRRRCRCRRAPGCQCTCSRPAGARTQAATLRAQAATLMCPGCDPMYVCMYVCRCLATSSPGQAAC